MVAVEILCPRWLSKSCDCSTSRERSKHGTPGTSTTTCSECSELKGQLGDVTWRLEAQEVQMDMLHELMEGLRSSMQILPPAPLPLPSSASPVVPSSNNPPSPVRYRVSGWHWFQAENHPHHSARCIHNSARNGCHSCWCLGDFVACACGRQHSSPAVHQCSWRQLPPSILPSTCNDGEWRNGGGCPDPLPHNSCKSCWSTHSWWCTVHMVSKHVWWQLLPPILPSSDSHAHQWWNDCQWTNSSSPHCCHPSLWSPHGQWCNPPVVSQHFYRWALPSLVPPFCGDHIRWWNAFWFQSHLFPPRCGESCRCFQHIIACSHGCSWRWKYFWWYGNGYGVDSIIFFLVHLYL